jgi:hypothetical protein
MQAIAARPIDRELAEGDEEQGQRQRREGLVLLGLHADQKIGEIDRREYDERENESEQKLASRAEIFERVSADGRVRLQIAANVGREPETVEAGRDQAQQRASAHEATERAVLAREDDRGRRRSTMKRNVAAGGARHVMHV